MQPLVARMTTRVGLHKMANKLELERGKNAAGRKADRLAEGERVHPIGLGRKVRVSRQAISKWETGRVLPSAENLKYLSELFGVSVDYLLSDDMTEEPKPKEQEPAPEPQTKEPQTEEAVFPERKKESL